MARSGLCTRRCACRLNESRFCASQLVDRLYIQSRLLAAAAAARITATRRVVDCDPNAFDVRDPSTLQQRARAADSRPGGLPRSAAGADRRGRDRSGSRVAGGSLPITDELCATSPTDRRRAVPLMLPGSGHVD